ncbi:MAG: (R,R)-butanediol dehydrogenase / meso-butanediol dehydrogenase / diacetyl reductase [Clostridiales bacterium]|nr:(R,R)-butanediol dehydrogenase / meso-butanediol dehydrogenase / diacetyl reductase [Clostridiales bacterium]
MLSDPLFFNIYDNGGDIMKAAVFYGTGDIRVEEVEKPRLKEGHILVEVKACGICGTDMHIYSGGMGPSAVKPPTILGHEFAGRVVEKGDGVSDIDVGDNVAVDPNIYCGHCHYCRIGKVHLCENLKNIGVILNGGFAEYCLVPQNQAYKLPPDMPYEVGAMVEPLACCLHGTDLAQIKPGDSVVILGGGAIGLLHAQLARLAGASSVIISEPSQGRRQLAQKLGFDMLIDPTDCDVKAAAKAMIPYGADVVIEAAGLARTAKQAFDLVKNGGTVLQFGVVDETAEIQLKPFEIYQKEIKWIGSFINPYTHARALELLAKGLIKVSPLITHRYSLDDMEEGLKPDKRGDRVKAMVII